MSRLLRWLPHALLVAATVALALVLRSRERSTLERARLEEIIRSRDAAIAQLEHRVTRVDAGYTVDTTRLTVAVSAYHATRDSLRHALARTPHVDTVRHTDTLTVERLVERTLATADSAIAACTATVTTCETRVAQRDSVIALLRAQRRDAATLAHVASAPRLVPYVAALADLRGGGAVVRAGADLRLLGRVGATASIDQPLAGDQPLRMLAGIRLTFE